MNRILFRIVYLFGSRGVYELQLVHRETVRPLVGVISFLRSVAPRIRMVASAFTH